MLTVADGDCPEVGHAGGAKSAGAGVEGRTGCEDIVHEYVICIFH